MSYRERNPYPKHTFTHFAWNVYGLLIYQFARFAFFAWIILVGAISYSLYKVENVVNQNHSLIKANQNRITDIQQSRISACESTYLAIEQVLRPFYPPKKVRTVAQQTAVNTFEHLIHNKIILCRKQAGVKK